MNVPSKYITTNYQSSILQPITDQLPIFNLADIDSPPTTGGEGGPVLCILTFEMMQLESN
jgi:hypothetical protein